MIIVPITMKRWTAHRTKIILNGEIQSVHMRAEVQEIMNEDVEPSYELELRFEPAVKVPFHPPIDTCTFHLSLDTDEAIDMPIEDFNKIARALFVSTYQVDDLTINPKKICKQKEVMKIWTIPATLITAHAGMTTTDLRCVLEKIHFDKDQHTLFERKVLKYRSYRHIIDVTPQLIRQNRDSDYLDVFAPEKNDEILSFTVAVEKNDRVIHTDFSEEHLNQLVYAGLKDFQRSRYDGKKAWFNREFFHIGGEKLRVGLFALIYPFHGDYLSGWTSLFEIEVENNDEVGLRLSLALFGFHLWISSYWLYKMMRKYFCKNRPIWESEKQDWNEYHSRLKEWQRKHPIEAFWDTQWLYRFNITRAMGFSFKKEFDHMSKPSWRLSFNPFRNKFWNLI